MKARFLLLVLLACLLAPVRALPPNDAVIAFNEIHYNPPGTGDAGEWIELFNMMSVNVDLSDWRIAGGVDYAFAAGTVIPAGGYLVVAKTPGSIAGALGPFTGTLSNSSATLRLLDNSGRAMDEVTYADHGDWPVAPDGGGATLAKRDPYSGSALAASWAASAQVGGTPGAANFPPPPPAVTTRMIDLASTWKYNNSGAAPDATWKTAAYAEPGWSSGPAGFKYGSVQLYQDAPLPPPGGVWSALAWTGDADSGISTAKSYTHKIGLNRAGVFTAINGVTFDSPGASVMSGAAWSLQGAVNSFTGNSPTLAGSGSHQLCENFFYGSALANGTSRLALTGLTPGASYIASFYSVGYGGPGGRIMRITPGDSGVQYTVDENAADSENGMIVKYHYKALTDGSMAFDFLPYTAGATWHHYAFSNEVATTASSEIENTGVTVASVSSQLTTGGYSRAAVNTVNGSGLASGFHGTVANGTMWLSNGVFTTPTNPLPAVITYDLGSAVHLTSLHVWNYNELSNAARGARQVEILVASTVGGAFTSLGTFTFIKASGLATEPGQQIEIDQQNVRQVRFNITSNQGGDNQFAGLSEVKFYKEGVLTPTPVPYVSAISTLYNSGAGATGALLAPGQPDPHYTNTGTGLAALAMLPNPAWLAADGLAQWIGFSGNGQDNAPAGQFTYRTTFDLTGYDATTASLAFYTTADNSLDNVLLNGAARGIATGGFGSYLGPFTIGGPFNAGVNTLDFLWSNAGPGANPGGLRIKWNAVASPLLTHTTLPANPVATYFRRHFTNGGGASSTYRLLLNYVVDDGAVFYLNGQEIQRVNMPAGTPTQVTLASGEVVYPKFSGVVEVPATALVPGDNVLAVELHQASAGNADAYFIATLDMIETPQAPSANTLSFSEFASTNAATWFAELRNTGTAAVSLAGYTLTTSGGASYYTFGAGATLAAGALLSLDQTALGFRPLAGDKVFLTTPGGTGIADAALATTKAQARDATGRWLVPSATTPGGANTFSLNTAIVVNEIMYKHHATFLPTGTVSQPEQWIELYNRSGSPVTLTGWKLSGGVSYSFPAGTTLAAGGYLVVSNDPASLLAKFPTITVLGPLSGKLSGTDDIVRVVDASGNPANEVHYYGGGRWDDRANGGGSSLELRNPNMDNTQAEAWSGSDETGKSQWQTFSYSGVAGTYPGSSEPATYNEFIFGLLSDGQFLIDDLSVKEVSVGNRECLQNGDFANGTSSAWRLLGTHGSHGRSVVVDDPAAPGNKVLKVVSTGPTEHMHNHCETTLQNAGSYLTINPASTYSISFRARWLTGSPRLQTRLYFNRLVRQNLLPMPDNNGTPGGPNSNYVANPGPTYSGLAHSPVLPDALAPVTVRIAASDPQSVAQMAVKWRLDGQTWQSAAMTLTGDHYEGTIPGQSAAALVQFYVEGQDGSGAISDFPAAGAASRALIRWKDGLAPSTPGQEFRLLMATADADFMHTATNVMSNDQLPCTVVYRGSEVFYDTTVRLKSSERGRYADTRVGFSISFDPMHLFRGTLNSVNLDRSGYGRGTDNSGFGQTEIVNWHFLARAGGVSAMRNDLVYFIAPRSQHTGSAMLTMAEFNDIYLNGLYLNGASTPEFKYELVYSPTTTTGGPEGLKLPQPDDVRGVAIGGYATADKEAYRWNFLIGNARSDDDYSRIINLNNTFAATGAAYDAALPNAIDIDQWLRTSAALSLAGPGDNYATAQGGWHNLKLYARADGRMIYLPWDTDFMTEPYNDPLAYNPDLNKIINSNPAYKRAFHGHLLDIIGTSFNTAYLTSWITYYQTFSTGVGNWSEITTYVNDRANFVTAQINAAYPPVTFGITTNGGANFSAPGSQVTLAGNGWVNVTSIRLQTGLVVPVVWTGDETWQISAPISPGTNALTLTALDYHGHVVGTASIAVTGTGSAVPAAAGNLVISELHYDPKAPTAAEISAGITDGDDFEFVEVRNISATATLSLSGVHFTNALTYTFPATTLAPGAMLVVPRRAAAFALRHPGVPTAPEYYQASGNVFSNSGEELALADVNGADIVRFTYGAALPWPAEPHGTGPSLVLIAPTTNPDPTNPLHWRASAGDDGNPGASDALTLPANLLGDDNGNGISNLVEHALGAGAFPSIGSATVLGASYVTFTLERAALADVSWDLESSATLSGWVPAGAAYAITARSALPGGIERVTLRGLAPAGGTASFLRARLSAQP